MQKICQICSVMPPGGDAVGEGALKLKYLLTENGYNSLILTSSDQLKDNGIFPLIKNWNFVNILKSVRFLKKEKVDLVIFHYPTPYYKRKVFVTLILLIYQSFGMKTISFLHEYSNYSIIGKIRIFPLILFSNRIITSDHDNFYSIIKIPYVKKKVSIITVGSNFLDLTFSNKTELLNKNSFQPTKFNLLYFGYIMHGKGLEILLEAFEYSLELKNKYNLYLVGKIPEIPNQKTKIILDMIKKSVFLEYIGFLPLEKLREYFDKIDLVCLPFDQGVTIRRGSFMSSMGFGKPVLTTEGKNHIDGLKENENVFLIKHLTRDNLIAKLITISSLSSEDLNEIGKKAQIWYMKNYSDENYIREIKRVLESIN